MPEKLHKELIKYIEVTEQLENELDRFTGSEVAQLAENVSTVKRRAEVLIMCEIFDSITKAQIPTEQKREAIRRWMMMAKQNLDTELLSL
jgi:hypothetical protein